LTMSVKRIGKSMYQISIFRVINRFQKHCNRFLLD
jgi:hypothetical protein